MTEKELQEIKDEYNSIEDFLTNIALGAVLASPIASSFVAGMEYSALQYAKGIYPELTMRQSYLRKVLYEIK